MTENVNTGVASSGDSAKREELLQTAKELFWKYGIRKVSVEEICKVAGVSKMTFYKYFPNKNGIVKTIIGGITSESMEVFRELMGSDLSIEEKISRSIEMKMQGTNEMSNEFLQDIHRYADDELREFMMSHYNANLQEIMDFYLEAQKRGEIRQDIKPGFILYFLEHMIAMADDPALASMYPNAQDLIRELTTFFFYGILRRNP